MSEYALSISGRFGITPEEAAAHEAALCALLDEQAEDEHLLAEYEARAYGEALCSTPL